jgi:hypothetical protein
MNKNDTDGRTDGQLIAILDETATWAVRGAEGAVLGQAASLREAIKMASKIEHRKIIALTQGPDDCVIVFNLLVAGFRLGWMDRQVIGFAEFWP